jgi:hypothetical protein
MAERTGVAVLVVMHLNKATLQPALYRVGGSIGFVGAARSVLLVACDREDPALRILMPTKANLSGEMPAMAFTITQEPALAWRGTVEANIADLLAMPSREKASRMEDAAGFLRQTLRGGPVAVLTLQQESRVAGLSWRTLERAKAKLGVEAVCLGVEGKQGAGGWYWRLPAVKAATPLPHEVGGHNPEEEMVWKC